MSRLSHQRPFTIADNVIRKRPSIHNADRLTCAHGGAAEVPFLVCTAFYFINRDYSCRRTFRRSFTMSTDPNFPIYRRTLYRVRDYRNYSPPSPWPAFHVPLQVHVHYHHYMAPRPSDPSWEISQSRYTSRQVGPRRDIAEWPMGRSRISESIRVNGGGAGREVGKPAKIVRFK